MVPTFDLSETEDILASVSKLKKIGQKWLLVLQLKQKIS